MTTNRFSWCIEQSIYRNSFYDSRSYAVPYLIYLKKTLVNIVKNKVTKYVGTIEDYLRQKGFKEVHFHESGTLPSHAHYGSKRSCSLR